MFALDFYGHAFFFKFSHHVMIQPHLSAIGDDQVQSECIQDSSVEQFCPYNHIDLLGSPFQSASRKCLK